MSKNHRWGDKATFPNKSERECKNGCGIIRVTRHEGSRHWREYWHGLDRLAVNKTPVCQSETSNVES